MESNDSPEIPDRGETSDIPGLPSGALDRNNKRSTRTQKEHTRTNRCSVGITDTIRAKCIAKAVFKPRGQTARTVLKPRPRFWPIVSPKRRRGGEEYYVPIPHALPAAVSADKELEMISFQHGQLHQSFS